MHKRFWAGLMVIAMILVGCGGKPSETKQEAPKQEAPKQEAPKASEPQAQPKKKLRAALVIPGGLGDGSFKDGAWAGAQKAAKDFNVDVKLIESKAAANYEEDVRGMAQEGYDLVIGLGFDFLDPIKKVAPQFPKVKFSLNDVGLEGSANVQSIVFKEHEGTFLAGALAAILASEKGIQGAEPTGTVGFVGGMDIPVIRKFLTGYEQGIAHVNKDVKLEKAFVGSFGDPAKGKELALLQYGRNANVIFNSAGGSGLGIYEAGKEKKRLVIGHMGTIKKFPGVVVAEFWKRTDQSVYDSIKMAADGSWKPGVLEYGLKENGVTIGAYADTIPKAVQDRIAALAKDVTAGKIKVNPPQK